jgi:hypothetical protein
MRSKNLIVILSVLVAAVLPLVGCEPDQPPRFPHQKHMASTNCGAPGQPPCASCRSCHGGLAVAEQRALPTENQCVACHQTGGAMMFAAQAKRAVRFKAKRSITYPHGIHQSLPAIGERCDRCHGGLADDGRHGGVYPTKPVCLECHQEDLDGGNCLMCHQDRTFAAQVPKTFMRHDLAFLRRHGEAATRQGKVCNQCHSQADCADCHDQGQSLSVAKRKPDAIDRGVIHRGDYLTRHPMEARLEPGRCVTCHTTSSCEGCHLQRGVSAAYRDQQGRSSAMPHGVGWLGPDTSSAQFHGRAAQRDITSCASCHDQGPASNCIRCHRPGGVGGTPHPDGWSSSRSPRDPMCAYCHGAR